MEDSSIAVEKSTGIKDSKASWLASSLVCWEAPLPMASAWSSMTIVRGSFPNRENKPEYWIKWQIKNDERGQLWCTALSCKLFWQLPMQYTLEYSSSFNAQDARCFEIHKCNRCCRICSAGRSPGQETVCQVTFSTRSRLGCKWTQSSIWEIFSDRPWGNKASRSCSTEYDTRCSLCLQSMP